MNENEKLDILEGLGIDYKYGVFKKGQVPLPPYAVWYIPKQRFNGSDDGKSYWIATDYVIEVYFAEKDFALESQIEDRIPAAGFEKTEEYFWDQEMYCITYKFTINEKRRMK